MSDLTGFLAARACACGRDGKLTRDMCTRCYRYWLDHTPPDQRPVAPRFARQFGDFVRKDGTVPSHAPELGPCWTWTGQTDPKGYGRWGKILAHRHSWMLANGSVPAGLWVLHHCDNPPCVNLAHLYLGTVIENVRDAMKRGHVSNQHIKNPRTHCGKGHLLAGENIRIVGRRRKTVCRICDNKRSRERQRAIRAARAA